LLYQQTSSLPVESWRASFKQQYESVQVQLNALESTCQSLSNLIEVRGQETRLVELLRLIEARRMIAQNQLQVVTNILALLA
jgi:hypothetical protein